MFQICSLKIIFFLFIFSFQEVYDTLSSIYEEVDFVICSGGVSMGDKDYIKPVLKKLNFNIEVGRVNMKPGYILSAFSRNSF